MSVKAGAQSKAGARMKAELEGMEEVSQLLTELAEIPVPKAAWCFPLPDDDGFNVTVRNRLTWEGEKEV